MKRKYVILVCAMALMSGRLTYAVAQTSPMPAGPAIPTSIPIGATTGAKTSGATFSNMNCNWKYVSTSNGVQEGSCAVTGSVTFWLADTTISTGNVTFGNMPVMMTAAQCSALCTSATASCQ